MSHCTCEHCGAILTDSPRGYVTGCVHYPADIGLVTQFARERDMREPVKAYLLARGFLPVVEFWLHGCGQADIVAGLYEKREGRRIPKLFEVVAVELKLHDVGGAISQAIRNKHCCDWSYVAMPEERLKRMRVSTMDRIRNAGLGLLAVGDTVSEHIAPERGAGLSALNVVENLWRRVRAANHANSVAGRGD